MWDRVGFAALLLATVLDAVWLGTLLNDGAADDASATIPAQSAQASTPRSAKSSVPVSAPASAPPPTDSGDHGEGDGTTATPLGVPQEAQAVVVSKHTDGDTLHVVPQPGSTLEPGVDITVRLLEIDTPESVDPNSPVECYAKKASEELARLLPIGATAWVVPDRELLDPYDRTLLYLWADDGEFVNLSMVNGGFAKAVLFEPNDRYIRQMRGAQRRARREEVGMWGTCSKARAHALTGVTTASEPTDPRFDYCYEANAAGFGNYIHGRDPEYAWYDDRDGDGRVCEF